MPLLRGKYDGSLPRGNQDNTKEEQRNVSRFENRHNEKRSNKNRCRDEEEDKK